jgi:hypothetical protein
MKNEPNIEIIPSRSPANVEDFLIISSLSGIYS